MTIYDRVYYWVGGSERGYWAEAWGSGESMDELRDAIARQGYFALKGSSMIGAPEGAPAR